MDEYIELLEEATVFSNLDDNSEYCQVEIENVEQNKAAITSQLDLYRFVDMLFGLKNVPETFLGTMDVIFTSVNWQLALVYLNDMTILD